MPRLSGQAQAGVVQVQAAVRLAKQALNDSVIRSPIDGVVAERKVEPGMQLIAGKDVMRLVSLTQVFFDAQLPEAQAPILPWRRWSSGPRRDPPRFQSAPRLIRTPR